MGTCRGAFRIIVYSHCRVTWLQNEVQWILHTLQMKTFVWIYHYNKKSQMSAQKWEFSTRVGSKVLKQTTQRKITVNCLYTAHALCNKDLVSKANILI